MKTQTLLSESELEAVRRRFGVLVQRREAIRLIRTFGCTKRKARGMLDGAAATFKPMPKQTRTEWSRWHRETIIAALNLPLTA